MLPFSPCIRRSLLFLMLAPMHPPLLGSLGLFLFSITRQPLPRGCAWGKSPPQLAGTVLRVPQGKLGSGLFWSLSIKAVFYPSYQNVFASTIPDLERFVQCDGGWEEAGGTGERAVVGASYTSFTSKGCNKLKSKSI